MHSLYPIIRTIKSTSSCKTQIAMSSLPPGLTITPHAISPENSAALQHWLQHDSAIPWEQAIEGRRVAQFGVRYDYTTQCVDLSPVTPLPQVLRQWLPNVTAEYTQCIINEYSPDDSIPFHTDASLFGDNILVFCLGEARPLLLRRTLQEDVPEQSFSIAIEHRWSYQMSSEVRTIWEHAVPAGTGRRTSLTFRSLVPGAALCSQKLKQFQSMEMKIAATESQLEHRNNELQGRIAQLHGCEQANTALVERVQRLERGEKAGMAKQRTWRRERAELRLENNKLAQQLIDLENEVVHFMNSKGLMDNENETESGEQGLEGGNVSNEKSRKKSKKNKKNKKNKKHKKNKHKHKQHGIDVDDISEEICPICREIRGTCVHTKMALYPSTGGRNMEDHNDTHISSDDSDATPFSKLRINTTRNGKGKRKDKYDLNKSDSDYDSEEEEARIRGGKVATSPPSTSSLTRAVSWLGEGIGAAVSSAAWAIGATGEEEDDESDYSIDSDATDEDQHEINTKTAKSKRVQNNVGPSLGRNMIYLKRQQEKSKLQQEQQRLSPNGKNDNNNINNNNTTAAAAAASSARRMKKGRGVSERSSVTRGSGIKIKPPSQAVTGLSSGMKKIVRRGGGNKSKQETRKVLKGSGVVAKNGMMVEGSYIPAEDTR